ncbi:MAG: hypothetical protein ACYC27_07175 [Armatimonadota bacterium]
MKKQIIWTMVLATAVNFISYSAIASTPVEEKENISMTEQVQSRRVLDGIPKISFGIHTCPFPGSLYSVLQYLKEPRSIDTIMGVSGAAFRRLWAKDDGSNVDIMHFSPDCFKRTADAIGYHIELIPSSDKTRIKSAIKESIDRGVPALAFGVIGPPECGIVAGYEQDGDLLYGYSYFQDAAIPGYYEIPFDKATWDGHDGLLVLGNPKIIKQSECTSLIKSLEWAIQIERATDWDKHVCGLAACKAWADAMEVDADYPKDDPQVMATRIMVHGDQTVMLYERAYAANYLREMAKIAPEAAKPLNKAADLYKQIEQLGCKVWPWGIDMNDPRIAQDLLDPQKRRGIASAIREAAKIEEKAVEQLELALSILKK